jgi:hypothetical protein
MLVKTSSIKVVVESSSSFLLGLFPVGVLEGVITGDSQGG